ncbi:MAG: NAD(P)H-dependent glycerol-3-phosphate dehydrogenase [Verrucomicrobiota bacterium]|nr:NAD(P)H-dependent glycerol-3-phosphate dehydrogenase [Verrucomicrobiota bacterium]
MKTTVIGAGAWGTALAKVVHTNGGEVCLWGRDAGTLAALGQAGRNEHYLPGIDIPRDLPTEADLARAVDGAGCVVLAVPSRAFREVTARLAQFDGLAVSVTKGIEFESGLTMVGILGETMPLAKVAALSGPTLAEEVCRDMPSAAVAASRAVGASAAVQQIFHRPTFRVYTSEDLVGVELGGALKNIIAIAAGASAGLGFGDNSKAALVTRAIAEMRRLGVACGARAETFAGLSGLGDLAVTCFSSLSRNYQFGLRIGRGEKPEAILADSVSVVEGYPTARSAWNLARTRDVSTPIIDEVYAMLHQGKDLREALLDLTTRSSKAED